MSESSTTTSATLDETRGISASILFMLFLLVANEMTQTFISKLKTKYSKIRYLQPTSITTLICNFLQKFSQKTSNFCLGVFAGIFLKYAGFSVILKDIKAGFSDFFMIVLLPPILFERFVIDDKIIF